MSPNQSKENRLKTVTVAHTPDMDDAFMFYGINKGAVSTEDLRFEHIIEDIETLNNRAEAADLDMTAISAAAYPALSKKYLILSVGSSVGEGYGPLVISKQPQSPEELYGCQIAVPGMQTTAAMLLRLAIPGCIPVEMDFTRIPEAVLKKKVDAGLVIHEWQLTYRDAGLLPVIDLGIWWKQQVRLPLPLGLNVAKRSIGKTTAQKLASILRNSILYAFAHQEEALAYAMQYARGTDVNRSKQFVSMYVNEETVGLSKDCRKGLRQLYRMAHQAGLIKELPRISILDPEPEVKG